MKARPFLSFAFLKAALDSGTRHPLDVLKPILTHSIRGMAKKKLRVAALQHAIESEWGIWVPAHVAGFLLDRLARDGLLLKDGPGVWRINRIDGTLHDVSSSKEEAVTTYNRVTTAIFSVITTHEIEGITPDQVLERFLDVGALSLFEIDTPTTSATPLDTLANHIVAKALNVESPGAESPFATDLAQLAIGDAIYRSIVSISEVENIEDELNVDKRMENVTLYFDTPLLYRALGWCEEDISDQTIEFLNMARRCGCGLCCWNHSIDEVAQGLSSIADRVNLAVWTEGPAAERARELGLTTSEILQRATSVSVDLTKLGIEAKDPPPLELLGRHLSIDEPALEKQIEIDVGHANPDARIADLKSLTAIYRARDGTPIQYLEKCVALFVTSNKSLARASDSYFRQLFRDQHMNNVVQLCMHDTLLATRLWLKVPTEFRGVPRSTVLRHALSTLRPSPDIERRFLKYIRDEVESGHLRDDVAGHMLLSQFTSRMLAMKSAWFGSGNDEDDFKNIVNRAVTLESEKLASLESDADARVEAVKSQFESLLSEQEKRAFAELKTVQASEAATIAQYEQELREARADSHSLLEIFTIVKYLIGRATRWMIRIATFAVFSIVLWQMVAVFLPNLGEGSGWRSMLNIGAAMVTLIFAGLTTYGLDLAGCFQRLENWVVNVLTLKFNKMAKRAREHILGT